ncbi:MAG: alpha/beta hydrolase [bacterium]
MPSETSSGRHIEVNGASLYVEEHGEGDALVLVHGGTVSSESWATLVPLLAKRFRVIVFDTRGHGRSTNPSGELTYERIADDTAALIAALGLEKPVVGGWSDGGQVALELEIRHPGVARALVAGGVMHNFQEPEFIGFVKGFFCLDDAGVADVENMERQHGDFVGFVRSMHRQSETQWQSVVQQTADMWRAYPTMTPEILAKVGAPTLVISGDRDGIVPLDHTIDFYNWLPNAELAILPGLDHMGAIMQPAMFAEVVADYIARH